MILDDHSYRHHRHDMTINICCPQLMVLTPTPATGWAAATSMVSSIVINVIVSLTVIVNTTIIIIVSNSGKRAPFNDHHQHALHHGHDVRQRREPSSGPTGTLSHSPSGGRANQTTAEMR